MINSELSNCILKAEEISLHKNLTYESNPDSFYLKLFVFDVMIAEVNWFQGEDFIPEVMYMRYC